MGFCCAVSQLEADKEDVGAANSIPTVARLSEHKNLVTVEDELLDAVHEREKANHARGVDEAIGAAEEAAARARSVLLRPDNSVGVGTPIDWNLLNGGSSLLRSTLVDGGLASRSSGTAKGVAAPQFGTFEGAAVCGLLRREKWIAEEESQLPSWAAAASARRCVEGAAQHRVSVLEVGALASENDFFIDPSLATDLRLDKSQEEDEEVVDEPRTSDRRYLSVDTWTFGKRSRTNTGDEFVENFCRSSESTAADACAADTHTRSVALDNSEDGNDSFQSCRSASSSSCSSCSLSESEKCLTSSDWSRKQNNQIPQKNIPRAVVAVDRSNSAGQLPCHSFTVRSKYKGGVMPSRGRGSRRAVPTAAPPLPPQSADVILHNSTAAVGGCNEAQKSGHLQSHRSRETAASMSCSPASTADTSCGQDSSEGRVTTGDEHSAEGRNCGNFLLLGGKNLLETLEDFAECRRKMEKCYRKAMKRLANEYLMQSHSYLRSVVQRLERMIATSGVEVYLTLTESDDMTVEATEIYKCWHSAEEHPRNFVAARAKGSIASTHLPVFAEPFLLLPKRNESLHAKLSGDWTRTRGSKSLSFGRGGVGSSGDGGSSDESPQVDSSGRLPSLKRLWKLDEFPIIAYSKSPHSPSWRAKAPPPPTPPGKVTRKQQQQNFNENFLSADSLNGLHRTLQKAPLLQLGSHLQLPVSVDVHIKVATAAMAKAFVKDSEVSRRLLQPNLNEMTCPNSPQAGGSPVAIRSDSSALAALPRSVNEPIRPSPRSPGVSSNEISDAEQQRNSNALRQRSTTATTATTIASRNHQSTQFSDYQCLEAATWLVTFIRRLVNDPHLHRLRWTYCQTMCAFDVVQRAKRKAGDGKWQHVAQPTFEIWWKMEEGNSVCVIDGTVEAKFFDLLSLIYEVDLHKTWIPFLKESRRQFELATTCQICRHQTNLPWPLPNRESLMMGAAVDALDVAEQQSIIVAGSSVPNSATSVWGVPIAPHSDSDPTRVAMKFFTFCIKPLPTDRSKVNCLAVLQMNPEMPVLPISLQSFLARHAATRMFKVMTYMCGKGRTQEHQAKMDENQDTYAIFKSRVENFYRKNATAAQEQSDKSSKNKKL